MYRVNKLRRRLPITFMYNECHLSSIDAGAGGLREVLPSLESRKGRIRDGFCTWTHVHPDRNNPMSFTLDVGYIRLEDPSRATAT